MAAIADEDCADMGLLGSATLACLHQIIDGDENEGGQG